MKPRHFWWLFETLSPVSSGPEIPREDRIEMLALLRKAKQDHG